jgi:hypothetical protein
VALRRFRSPHTRPSRALRPRNPPVWLEPDDVVEITIEGIGTIRNRVVAENGDRSGWRWRPGAPPSGL